MFCSNLMVLLFGEILRSIVAFNCPGLPDTSDIQPALKTLVANSSCVKGDPGSLIVTIVSGPFFTCQVQGTTVGTYQEVSLIVVYNSNEGNAVRQFEMYCVSGGPWLYMWDYVNDSLSTPGVNYTTISLWTNCSECVTENSPNENHCQCESQPL